MNTFRALLRGGTPSFIIDRIRTHRAKEREALFRAAFYKELIGEGKTIFDVGANVGNRVEAFLRIQSRVVAVEPQPSCVAILQRRFGDNPNLTIVSKALGSSPGTIRLNWSSDADVLASVSDSFVKYAENSERFKGVTWEKNCMVEVATLDSLIDLYRMPDFIKLDVEGHEFEVLKGLSKAPACLSFEFTPDFQDNVATCLSACGRIGMTQFNISYGESMRLARTEWISEPEMVRVVEALRGDTWLFGDIYARKP